MNGNSHSKADLATNELKQSDKLNAWIDQVKTNARLEHQTTDRLSLLAAELWDVAQSEVATFDSGPRAPQSHEFPEIPGYEVVDFIGRGGMGAVFRARDLKLGRTVALKVLVDDKLASDRAKQRFQVEVQAAAQLDHPSIVTVFAFGEFENGLFYSMREIKGIDLARKLGQGQTESLASSSFGPDIEFRSRDYQRWVAGIGISMADALAHSHERLVIHRDIKPANIIVDRDGNAFLADFGLARLNEGSDLTGDQDVMGSLRYMSPEQIESSRQVDHRSDIYSLGVTLYELLVGQPAVNQDTLSAMWQQVKEGRVARPRSINASIETDLETIILKAISPEPEFRYATTKEFGADLTRYLEVRPIHARPPTIGLKLSRWIKRNKRWVATSGLIAGFLLAVIFGFAVHNAVRAARDGKIIRVRSATLLDEAGVAKLRNADGILAVEDFQQASKLAGDERDALRQRRRIDGVSQWAPNKKRIRPFDGRLIAVQGSDVEVTTETSEGKSSCFIRSGSERKLLFSTRRYIQRATFSLDGSLCAVLSGDRTNHNPEVRIYNTKTGELFLLSEQFEWRITDLFFLKDNRSLFLTGWSGTGEVWDSLERQLIKRVTYPGGMKCWVFDSSRTADRDLVCAVVFPGKLVAYRLPTLDPVWEPIELANWRVEALTVSRAGKWVAVGNSVEGIRIWHVESGKEVQLSNRQLTRPTAIAFSRDESLMAVGDHFGNVRVWKLSDGSQPQGKQMGLVMHHNLAIHSLKFNDRFQLSVATPQKVTVWRLSDNRKISSLPVETGIRSVSWVNRMELAIGTQTENGYQYEYWRLPDHLSHEISGDGSVDKLLANETSLSIYVKPGSDSGQEAFALDPNFNSERRPTQVQQRYLTGPHVLQFKFSENRKRAVSIQQNKNGTMRAELHSVPDMESIGKPVELGYGPFRLDVDSIGDRWLLGGNDSIDVRSAATGEILFSRQLPNWVKQVAFLSDGGVAATCWDGKLRIWDADGTLVHEFDHRTIPDYLATKGRQLIVAHSNELSLYQLKEESWKLSRCVAHNSGLIECIEICNDETRFVTCGDNGQTILWSGDAGRVSTLDSSGPVVDCRFSGNNQWMATLGYSGGIDLWESRTGRTMSATIFGSEPIQQIAWLKDELYFSSRSSGKYGIQKISLPASWHHEVK